jgi:hypothetical protein
MSLLRIALIWRLPWAVLLGGCTIGVVLALGDASLQLPMGVGPRLVRQAALLFLPLALSVLVMPPVPDLHPSLLRASTHHRISRGLFWVLMGAACAAGWLGAGITGTLLMFEVTSTLVLTAAALFLVPRLGGRMILTLTAVGCAWLLYGVLAAKYLGFGDLTVTDDHYMPEGSTLAWILLATSVIACLLASVPTKPTHRT